MSMIAPSTNVASSQLKLSGGAREPRSKRYSRPTFSSKKEEVSRLWAGETDLIELTNSVDIRKKDSLQPSAFSPSSVSMRELQDTLPSEMPSIPSEWQSKGQF